MKGEIFLPGGTVQFRQFLREVPVENKKILVMGSNSEKIAAELAELSHHTCELIVEEYDSFMNSNMRLKNNPAVSLRLMSFENTDFHDDHFDIIYSQATLSMENRNRILKEIVRILKPSGILCTGEIVALERNVPVFVRNVWENSSLKPQYSEEFSKYYAGKNFQVLYETDLSGTLKSFYTDNSRRLKDESKNFTEEEKSYYKKLLNRISHETNVYLKQGGDKFIGYKMLVLQKLRTEN